MLVYKAIMSIFSTIIGLFQILLFPSTASITANLKAASANAKTYEEWLLCQEELDALSGRNIWSATFSLLICLADDSTGVLLMRAKIMTGPI
jgi:hypothetical protein